MAMEIVIPFVNESHWSNNELNYCIKSIRKNVQGTSIINLVGEPCDILVDNYIKVNNKKENKAKDIAYKIYMFCRQTKAKEFILFNDDYFVNKPLDLTSIIAYSEESLFKTLDKCHPSYLNFIYNTINFLQILNKNTINYDVHYPMKIETDKFIEIYERFYRGNNKYLVKSLYGNYYEVPYHKIIDVKIRQNLSLDFLNKILKDIDVFSISNGALVHNYNEVCSIKYYLKTNFD